MMVQKFLLNHSLEDLENKHKIKHRWSKDQTKFSLNYDMIESKESDKLACECRGLVLAPVSVPKSDTDIVGKTVVLGRPMLRFFNQGQVEAAKINFEAKDTKFYEKLDGCADGSTIIYTENGKKTIKEICNSQAKLKILSYNTQTKQLEFDQIVGHSIQENNNNWYEIELEDKTKIKLTGNHKVYLPSLNCYRKVEDLKGNERILFEKFDGDHIYNHENQSIQMPKMPKKIR